MYRIRAADAADTLVRHMDPALLMTRPIWVHGNGFIQVALWDHIQLQVWDDSLELGQNPHTPIHNHRFDFEAHVLTGALDNTTYKVFPDFESGTHWAYKVVGRKGENTDLVPAGNMLHCVRVDDFKTISKGYGYTFRYGDFHCDTGFGLTAVVQVKHLSRPWYTTRVMVPKFTQPDNVFDRYQRPPEELWPSVLKAVWG